MAESFIIKAATGVASGGGGSNGNTTFSPELFVVNNASPINSNPNFYIENQKNWYFQQNVTDDFNINVSYSSTVTLDSYLSEGEAITIVIVNNTGSTAYQLMNFYIDQNLTTVKWLDGTYLPLVINKSNVMSFTIMKLSTALFVVFGSISNY